MSLVEKDDMMRGVYMRYGSRRPTYIAAGYRYLPRAMMMPPRPLMAGFTPSIADGILHTSPHALHSL